MFPKLRQDVVDLIVECFDAKDCKTVLEGSVVGTCAEEAVASVAPSGEATAFCDSLSAAKKKCGNTTTKATCLDQAKLYSDETIVEAANCGYIGMMSRRRIPCSRNRRSTSGIDGLP